MIEVLKQALEALEKVKRRAVVMGSTGDYREGQLDALKAVSEDVKPAITPLRQAIAELEREKEIHDRHCNQGEWKGVCKYSDSNCPTIAELKSQEPVAWLLTGNAPLFDGEIIVHMSKPKWIPEWWRAEPLYTAPPQRTEQEPVALPCCGYRDASAVKWNSLNDVVQCHNCGQTYALLPQEKNT